MPANYVLLEKITVGAAGASSVTFSSIPQTGYTDLIIKTSARGTQAAASHALTLRFNGSTTSYSGRELVGDGSAVSSGTRGVFGSAMYIGNIDGNSATSSTFSNTEICIPNYTSSNFKSVSVDGVSENNATEAYTTFLAGLWSDTAAITSIDLVPFASHGTLMPNSTFYLYGVAKLGTTPAIVPYATGGDTIMTDGTYWYHAFLSSGTFTPQKGLSCDVLVVAGGGGGAGAAGSAGGAGGYQLFSTQSLTSTGYTVTVGAGGGGGTGSGQTGISNGSNSQFGALTASVGGGRGGSLNVGGTPTVGGSGGGGTASSVVGANGTAGQGNKGGDYNVGTGGGGGAGAAGSPGAGGNAGGSGGAGKNSESAWLSVTGTGVSGFIAGGGGGGGNAGAAGGAAGSGGASAGTAATNASAATANTGSGGGGGGFSGGAFNGGNGGSGLVIVRYAV
jgi:hypothetical protein